MDSTMMYLHVKKIGNESVDPVKNLWTCKLHKIVGILFSCSAFLLSNIDGIYSKGWHHIVDIYSKGWLPYSRDF